jgi:hypothetical protein
MHLEYYVPPDVMTDIELIAAIIEDSQGYAGFTHARRHVRDYRSGETGTGCERGTCSFDRDLNALIEQAAQTWAFQLSHDTAKAARLLAHARHQKMKTENTDDSTIGEMQESMNYPVAGV